MPRPNRFVYFCIMTQQSVDDSDRQNLFFFVCTYSPQTKTVRPLPKPAHKSHILGMSTSPRNNSHRPKLCHLSCTPITNTPQKYTFSVVFGTCKTLRRNLEIFQRFTHAHTDSRLYFKNDQNWCRISGQKSALYW